MKELTKVMLALAVVFAAGFGLAACDDDDASTTGNNSFTVQNN